MEPWYDDGSIWNAQDSDACLERGGNWESEDDGGWCWEEYIMEDDGSSIWTAPDEGTCIERGGEWEWADRNDPDNTDGWCMEPWEDSGSVWDAEDEGTCLERGGLWIVEGDQDLSLIHI